MRDIRYPEALPDRVFTLSNTASAASTVRPVLRTVDATTNFVTDGGTQKVAFNLKLVDASGAAMRGTVNVAVVPAGTTLANDAFAASVGTPVGPNNGATTPTGGSRNFVTATTGILTGTCQLSGASVAGALVIISYGGYQVVATVPIA